MTILYTDFNSSSRSSGCYLALVRDQPDVQVGDPVELRDHEGNRVDGVVAARVGGLYHVRPDMDTWTPAP